MASSSSSKLRFPTRARGPDERVLRRTVEPILGTFVPVLSLDVPVPQSVVQPVDVLKILDISSSVEQVIDVPKIIQDNIPQRAVLRVEQVVLLMFEQSAGHRVTFRRGCQFFLGLFRSLGHLPGGLARFAPCSRLLHVGWGPCEHGLSSRPHESCHMQVIHSF